MPTDDRLGSGNDIGEAYGEGRFAVCGYDTATRRPVRVTDRPLTPLRRPVSIRIGIERETTEIGRGARRSRQPPGQMRVSQEA